MIFILGVLADKDYDAIIDIILPLAEEFICLTPVSERALSAEGLEEFITTKGAKAESADSIEEGIRMAFARAKETGKPIVAFGSLYLAGAVRSAYKNYQGF